MILLLFLNTSCKDDASGPVPDTITPVESEHFSFVLYDGLSASTSAPILEKLNTDYNSGNQKIYAVGYLLSEYIIETWGKESYVRMIKFNANLGTVLNVTTLQFESGWKEFVTKKYLVGS